MKKFLLLFLLLASALCAQVSGPHMLSIPGDGAVQIVRSAGAVAPVIPSPPLTGLKDVWIWSDYTPASTTWNGSINNESYARAFAMPVASNAVYIGSQIGNNVLLASSSDLSIFMIQYAMAKAPNHGIMGSASPVNFVVELGATNCYWYDYPPRNSYLINVTGLPTGVATWTEVEFYLAASGTSYIEVNGTRKNGATVANTAATYNLGLYPGGANGWQGYVKCFAIYNGVLDNTARADVWRYLRSVAGDYLP